jgi:hypothetical protein
MGRWDFVEELRLLSTAEAIAGELAKQLAGDLERWPPEVEWSDERERARFAPLYALGAARPSRIAFAEGFRLARWELEHEVEAIDDYWRNGRDAVAGGDLDRLAVRLLWRYLTEAALTVAEATQGRVKRRHLLDCLEQAERRVAMIVG